MRKLPLVACIISALLSTVFGQCNQYPLMFGSIKGDTNITVVEYSVKQEQLWVGGATYDDSFAGGASLQGGVFDFVPYVA